MMVEGKSAITYLAFYIPPWIYLSMRMKLPLLLPITFPWTSVLVSVNRKGICIPSHATSDLNTSFAGVCTCAHTHMQTKGSRRYRVTGGG